MGSLHDAIPCRDRSAVHALEAEQLETPHTPDDVQNGVYGPDFVQVHAFHGRRVERCLLFGDHRERAIGTLFHYRRQRRAAHDFANLPQMTPMRLWRDVEVDLLARDLTSLDVGDTNADA